MALSHTESEGESSSLFGSPVPKFVKEREVPSGPVVTTLLSQPWPRFNP